MAIRIPVCIVIEMDDDQEREYRECFELPEPPRAKDIVESVRGDVLLLVRDSAPFTAGVNIKEG